METTGEPSEETHESKMFRSMFAVPQIIYFIPPWSQADFKERKKLLLYYAAIYLPVCFLLLILVALYTTYVCYLVVPLISDNDDRPELYFWQTESEHEEARGRGILYLISMTFNVSLFAVSFVRASSTPPGTVPNNGEWDPNDSTTKSSSVERKKDGTYRACARCVKLKPDRCHHCRLCDTCILKMDHHCPWIANCVGFYNYKYFFLIVTYAMMSLWQYMSTFWEALLVYVYDSDASTALCFLLFMLYSLTGLLGIAVTGFWLFHISLMSSNTTTIEHCEKRRSEDTAKVSPYNLSIWQNFKGALGKNPMFWMLPICKA